MVKNQTASPLNEPGYMDNIYDSAAELHNTPQEDLYNILYENFPSKTEKRLAAGEKSMQTDLKSLFHAFESPHNPFYIHENR